MLKNICVRIGKENSSIATIDFGEKTVLCKLKQGYGENNHFLRTQLHFNDSGGVDCDDILVNQEPERSILSLKRKVIETNGECNITIDGVNYSSSDLLILYLKELLSQADFSLVEVNEMSFLLSNDDPEHFQNLLKNTALHLGISVHNVHFVKESKALAKSFQRNGNSHSFSFYMKWDDAFLVSVFKYMDEEVSSVYEKTIQIPESKLELAIIKYFIETGKKQSNSVCEQIDLQIFSDENRLRKFIERPVFKKLKRFAKMLIIKSADNNETISLTIPPLHPKHDRTGIEVELSSSTLDGVTRNIMNSITIALLTIEMELLQVHRLKVEDMIDVWVTSSYDLFLNRILKKQWNNFNVTKLTSNDLMLAVLEDTSEQESKNSTSIGATDFFDELSSI